MQSHLSLGFNTSSRPHWARGALPASPDGFPPGLDILEGEKRQMGCPLTSAAIPLGAVPPRHFHRSGDPKTLSQDGEMFATAEEN